MAAKLENFPIWQGIFLKTGLSFCYATLRAYISEELKKWEKPLNDLDFFALSLSGSVLLTKSRRPSGQAWDLNALMSLSCKVVVSERFDYVCSVCTKCRVI
jgi:hypothetical protein